MLNKSAYIRPLILASLIPMTTILPGCIYEYDQCPPAPQKELSIIMDWNDAPDAAPEGMAFFFFPYNGGEPWRFDFSGREAGAVRLPYGKYRLITRNNDTSGVMFEHTDSYSEYSAYCRKGSLLEGVAGYRSSATIPNPDPNEWICICPDPMWSDTSDYIDFTNQGVVYSSDTGFVNNACAEIICHPRRITARYTWLISGINNLKNVRRMCAVLSGMSNAFNFASNALDPCPHILTLSAKRINDTSVGDTFYTYGYANGHIRQWLALYVWLNDGRKRCYEFNVSDQIHDAPDPMNVSISITGLEIPPDSIGTGGGSGSLDIDVDEWHTIIIDLGK